MRYAENEARKHIEPLWREMKKNAFNANLELKKPVAWPAKPNDSSDEAGATLFVSRLKKYYDKSKASVKVHIIGHSAGSIFAAFLAPRLSANNIVVDNVDFYAPAIRVDQFDKHLYPLMQSKGIKNLRIFELSDVLEQKDKCMVNGVGYDKSILYLVSRALEPHQEDDNPDVPILGMNIFRSRPFEPGRKQTLGGVLDSIKCSLIESPKDKDKTTAEDHGDFSRDPITLASTAKLILKSNNVVPPK
jgi:hypothetical protein